MNAIFPSFACMFMCMVNETDALRFHAPLEFDAEPEFDKEPHSLAKRLTPSCNSKAVWSQCDDCLHPVFKGFPINDEMRERAEFLGDPSLLLQVLGKTTQPGRNVRIDTLGGSFTLGKELEDRQQAWPMQLQILMSKWGNITVDNHAKGGCNTECWLSQWGYWKQIEKDAPDMIIFEMAINDQNYGSEKDLQKLSPVFEALLHRLKNLPSSPAILAVEAFRTAKYKTIDRDSHCPLKGPSKQGNLGEYIWCSHWWEVASEHQRILNYFGIPFFSYRDLVWPNYESPPAELPKYWNGLSHADQIAHFLIADGVTAMLSRINHANCNQQDLVTKTYPEPSTSQDLICNLGTVYVANHGLHRFPRSDAEENVDSVWQFGEDKAGKPGWIGDFRSPESFHKNLSISFRIATRGKLQVEYLESYHNMGKVAVQFDAGPVQEVLDGFTPSYYSVTKIARMKAPVGVHTVTFSLVKDPVAIENAKAHDSPSDIARGTKFKLLGLYGC